MTSEYSPGRRRGDPNRLRRLESFSPPLTRLMNGGSCSSVRRGAMRARATEHENCVEALSNGWAYWRPNRSNADNLLTTLKADRDGAADGLVE